MSTLQCTNIQDTSGGNSLTTAQNYSGTAKAWVNFNGTTSPGTIRASFNVSSVTKSSTGTYVVNLTSAMSDTNYVCIGHGSGGYPVNSSNYNRVIECAPNTTSSVSCITYAPNNAAVVDITYCSVSVFR